MKLVVFGATGGLGTYLRRECEKHGVSFVDAARDAVANPEDAVFVNCVGYGDVKTCETQPLVSLNINALCVANALGCINAWGAWGRPIIHVSTNDIFSKQGEHTPYSAPSPKNTYDFHKALAESILIASYPHNSIIMRGTFMSPFSKSKGGETFYYQAYKRFVTALAPTERQEYVRGYQAQITCPVSIDTYAHAIYRLALDYDPYCHSIVHVSLNKPCSRYTVLSAIDKCAVPPHGSGLVAPADTPPEAERNSYLEPSFGFCYTLEEEAAKFVKVCEEYARTH